MSVRVITTDVRAGLSQLPDESVHCCVTSPPYYGLRDYGIEAQVWGGDPGVCKGKHAWGDEGKSEQRLRNGLGSDTAKVAFAETLHPSTGTFCLKCGAWRGSLGLEPTPALYIEHMVAVFREVRRVLRQDGTLWLNIGDSYSGGSTGRNDSGETRLGFHGQAKGYGGPRKSSPIPAGIKPKDLLGTPWMLAFALRDDGWWLRSEITWAKRAPMPESVTDRPTSATEKVFLLTKSPRYFYNAEAVKEPTLSLDPDHPSYRPNSVAISQNGRKEFSAKNETSMRSYSESGRNMRNWWLLGPEPFPDAHFATFPTEIPRRAILAGTSERGVCPKCGAPWERATELEYRKHRPSGGRQSRVERGNKVHDGGFGGWGSFGDNLRKETTTIGWRPACSCDAGNPLPATVLDPFLGAGTTALVADRLGRHCIGIELNPEYAAMAKRRIWDDAPLFVEIAAE